jgi:hypothetical protein
MAFTFEKRRSSCGDRSDTYNRPSAANETVLDVIVLSLILVLPILGLTGVFPPPTQDLYNTPEAFQFIVTLQEGRYITIIMAVVHVIALVCLWTRRTA